MYFDNFDIGKDLQDAQYDGYKSGTIDALEKLIDKLEKDLTKSSWYSKGMILKLVKDLKEEYENIKI